MRPIAVLGIALFVAACGPTAEVINSPSPPGESPSLAPTIGATTPPSSGPTGASGSSTPLPLTTPSPPINLSTPTPSTAPGGSFQVLDGFPVNGAFEVDDVTSTSTGFVAVGFGGLDGDTYLGLRQGIVWTSADGMIWSQSVDPSLRNVTPISVVARGADLFLVGVLSACSDLTDEYCADLPQAGNAVWHSSDAVSWERLPQWPDMQLGGVDSMILAGDGLVVFGDSGEGQTPTAWFSTDGVSWTSTTDLAGLDPISSMILSPTGFTAFGTRYVSEAGDFVLTAALSGDGAHFTATSAPQLAGAWIDDVVAGVNGFVGVGYQSTEVLETDALAVHSVDGINWAEAASSDGSFAGSALQTVHALPSGYVAVGYRPNADDFTLQDGQVWFSAEGQDWRAGDSLNGTFTQLNASALGSSGLVVFAGEQTDIYDDDLSSVIHAWYAPLSALRG